MMLFSQGYLQVLSIVSHDAVIPRFNRGIPCCFYKMDPVIESRDDVGVGRDGVGRDGVGVG